MPLIELVTEIPLPAAACYDLERSVQLHLDSAAATGERIVSGKTSGLLEEGDEITWEARHLFKTRRLRSRVESCRRPGFFISRMVEGDFRKLVHEHHFEAHGEQTIMRDHFYFELPFGILGHLVAVLLVKPHLRRFLLRRNKIIVAAAQSGTWKEYLA